MTARPMITPPYWYCCSSNAAAKQVRKIILT
jgi:hypothetical protein